TDGKSSSSICLISCYCFFLNYARYKRGAAYLYFLRLRDHYLLHASAIIEDQRWSSMMTELRDK
ncbi:hypothetical protein, partial [Segatella copri]|uniref:hypothetical protein n=1 Tax=Segatella copri TaxID=165179 RepID=UPI001D17D299